LIDSASSLRLEGVGMDELLKAEKEKTQRLKALAKEHENRQTQGQGPDQQSEDAKKDGFLLQRNRSRSQDRKKHKKDKKSKHKKEKKSKKEKSKKEKIRSLYKI